MNIANIVGHIGNIGFLYGAMALSKKDISGWYAQILANFLYIIQSLIMNNPSLLWLSITLIMVNLYGIYKWSKKSTQTIDNKIVTSANEQYIHKLIDFYDDTGRHI